MTYSTQPQNFNLSKVAYSVPDILAVGAFGSRASFYRAVKAGKLRLTKQGSRTIVLAHDLANYLASLEQYPQQFPKPAEAVASKSGLTGGAL